MTQAAVLIGSALCAMLFLSIPVTSEEGVVKIYSEHVAGFYGVFKMNVTSDVTNGWHVTLRFSKPVGSLKPRNAVVKVVSEDKKRLAHATPPRKENARSAHDSHLFLASLTVHFPDRQIGAVADLVAFHPLLISWISLSGYFGDSYDTPQVDLELANTIWNPRLTAGRILKIVFYGKKAESGAKAPTVAADFKRD
ncbi:predicted protein [Nematostella vectensis]|uniref:Uncharacterized protein n=1 Tax=Nematostella vectensis TaxID=45351 RepID=A7S538_NEMVE|nr:predicted protein [Nematostella vectensis]|eukprot:XP_001633236.1 predicted protein [Nematostella vectensis]